MVSMKSALRDALDTMKVDRSGRPMADIVRMAARLGSSIPDTAAVLDCHCERVINIVEGRDTLSHSEADVMHAYLLGLWWWHSYRMKYKGADRLESIVEAHRPLVKVWERLPQGLRQDWATAHREAKQHWKNVRKTKGYTLYEQQSPAVERGKPNENKGL